MTSTTFDLRRTRHRQTRYLAQSIRLAEAETPGILRGAIAILCASVLAFIVWASFSSVGEIARAPGEATPASQSRLVQHRDGGTIAAVLVRDGQTVKKGDALLRLDDVDIRQDLARAQARQTTLNLQEERLRALLDNRAPAFAAIGDDAPGLIADQSAYLKSQQDLAVRDSAVIDDQIRQKQAELAALQRASNGAERNAVLMQGLADKRRALNRQGVLSDVRLLETEQKYNDATAARDRLRGDIASTRALLAELTSRKQALGASRADEAHRELDGVLAQSGENRELITKLQNKLEHLLITAPVAGMVQGLNLHLRGSVIQPGQAVMEIVPLDAPLLVTLRIRPADVGHLHAGQQVQVKVSSFNFARYGAVGGTLKSLSPSTFSGENGERFYEGTVALDTPYVGTPANLILPGMTVMADIVTGEKTIMMYLLKPLQSAMATAFTER